MVIFSHRGHFVAIIALLALVFTSVNAYDKNNRLVDYNDVISIESTTELGTEVLNLELYSFPYIQNFQQNKTSVGELCWVEQWSNYTEDCYGKDSGLKWILINPFDKLLTNELIKNLEQDTPQANAIVGLIFDTPSMMTSESTYAKPPIMSEATPGQCAKMKPFCYNQLEDPTQGTYKATYQHFFVENCGVLSAIVPTYFVYAASWLLIAGLFTLYLYVFIPVGSRLSLNKSLLLLPALKAMEVVLEGVWLDYCPWVGMSNSAYQYIQMARISIITICYTVFIAIFYLLSKGWQLCVQQLNRNQATNLTMIMGAVYLLYSAYFLSVDFASIYEIMSIIIALLYLGLAYSFTTNNIKNTKRIWTHMQMLDPNQENVMRPSFVMKQNMIRWITVCALGFCMTKFFDFALLNILDDSFAKARGRLVLQSFDFVWILTVMVVCRPRKEWPAYFTLSINELPGVEDANGQRNATLPGSLTSTITEKFLFDEEDDDKKSCGSIGSDEAVMFVNPCNYTLEVDDFDYGNSETAREISAFDPDVIEEESLGGDKSSGVSREDLRKQIEAGTHTLDQAHIKSELFIGFRDKKQIKKLKKEKAVQSQSRQRTSLYNRLFNRGTEAGQQQVLSATSSDSEEEGVSNESQPLNHSMD